MQLLLLEWVTSVSFSRSCHLTDLSVSLDSNSTQLLLFQDKGCYTKHDGVMVND